ncbi:MAG: thiol reductant ABC exporter subunit CydD [Solirubrobacterales bacterium]|nr:thiol reductant ABC exporter subunit CydD [Solirubrobacterales bacterium]
MTQTQSRAPGAGRRARETQRRLARSSRAARKHLITTVGIGLSATALIIAQATLLALVISGVFMEGKSFADVAPLLLWLGFVSIGRGLTSAGFETSGRLGAAKVMAELRTRLAEHLLLKRPGALQAEHSGELVNSAVGGVGALENYFARYLPQAVLAAIVPIAILVWVFPYDWKAAAILAITAPLIPIFMVLIGLLTESRTRDRWQQLSHLSAHFLDVVGGLETLRANGRAEAQTDSIGQVGDLYRRETMGALRIGFVSALVLELLAMIGVAMVATAVGIQLADGRMELTAGLTILLLAPEMYMPLRQLGNQFHASADGMAAAERIFEVLDQPASVTVAPEAVAAPDPAEGPIKFKGVSFEYPDRGPVFEDLDLTIAAGETVALVGPSGGGKSTIVSLLLRLADPDQGRITCSGVDLANIKPDEWRHQIAWVPQRPTIFAGSLEENLRLFQPDAASDRLEEVVEKAGLASLVGGQSEGLSMVIGEGGRRLSVGQSQRVALGRALLSSAHLVVLDEPTAHLDRQTEELLGLALDELTASPSALIVSHRDRPLVSADRILRLGKGRLTDAPDLRDSVPT